MKTLYHLWNIIVSILALISLLCGLHFKQQNTLLRQATTNFTETIKEKQCLVEQNAALKKRWKYPNDVLANLSEHLILPRHEISNEPINIYDPEVQHEVRFYENYLSGFIAYDNCVKFLEKLCETQFPILITSLSIHRNIAHNYALQLSMTYRAK